MRSITADGLKRELDRAQGVSLIDVRTREEFNEGHIPGAINIPLSTLHADDPRIKDTGEVYVNCLGGADSAKACSLLISGGIDAVNVTGGFNAWKDAGYTTNAAA